MGQTLTRAMSGKRGTRSDTNEQMDEVKQGWVAFTGISAGNAWEDGVGKINEEEMRQLMEQGRNEAMEAKSMRHTTERILAEEAASGMKATMSKPQENKEERSEEKSKSSKPTDSILENK